MPAMAGTLYLGTSGFGYEEWRHGVFYPDGLPASRMLSYYATLFRSVEINYTFREFPSQKVLTSWLQQTPEGFRFTLKANQRITHVRRLRDVAGEVRAFMNEAAVLGDQLGPVLFKCPPTVEYDEGLLPAFADGLPPGVRRRWSSSTRAGERPVHSWPRRQLARCVADTDEAPASEDDRRGGHSRTCGCGARPTGTQSWACGPGESRRPGPRRGRLLLLQARRLGRGSRGWPGDSNS